MNDKKKSISYEVTDGNGGWNYMTFGEALKQLREMTQGFPENIHMSGESREYWKKARGSYYVIKVETTREIIFSAKADL